jgi:uncharacterized protein (TIGR00369 family)
LATAAPFARALGFEVEHLARGETVLKVPYQEKFVGDASTGVVHGGLITSLLDHTLGFAVFAALDELVSIATLDMRIDYMRAAEPGRDIFARARVSKLGSSVAFVSGAAYHQTADDPIATSAAAFMIASDGARMPGADLP